MIIYLYHLAKRTFAQSLDDLVLIFYMVSHYNVIISSLIIVTIISRRVMFCFDLLINITNIVNSHILQNFS